MHVEFTMPLAAQWNSMIKAIQERPDNLPSNKRTKEKELLLEKVETDPEIVVLLNEQQLLMEMAMQTTKKWSAGKTLNVFFFGGQDARTQKVLKITSEWSRYCSITFAPVGDTVKSDKSGNDFQQGGFSGTIRTFNPVNVCVKIKGRDSQNSEIAICFVNVFKVEHPSKYVNTDYCYVKMDKRIFAGPDGVTRIIH